MPVADVVGGYSLTGGIKCNRFPTSVQQVQLSNLGLSDHLSPTLWLGAKDVSGFDIQWVNETFWDMRSRGRWMAEQGLDAATIMGDTCPAILPPSSSSSCEGVTDYWTVSRWALRFVESFPHIRHSDRLACWIVIFVNFQVRKISMVVDIRKIHIDFA